MSYTQNIIELVTPIFKHIKYIRDQNNSNIYDSYESSHRRVMILVFELFSKKCMNKYYIISERDYDNIKSECIIFENILSEIEKRLTQ